MKTQLIKSYKIGEQNITKKRIMQSLFESIN